MVDLALLYGTLWVLLSFEFILRRPAGGAVFLSTGRGPSMVRSAPPPTGVDHGELVLIRPWFAAQVFVSGPANQGRTSVGEVEARFGAYQRESKILRRAELALMLQLFAVLPVVWLRIGIGQAWPYLLLGVLALHFWTIAAFFMTYGRLTGAGAADRWMAALPLILAPPAATVAHLALTKKLFRDEHPVALAAVLCDDHNFRALALPYLRRATFPLAGASEEDPAETSIALRDNLRRMIEERLGSAESIEVSPERRSETARAYCPRCLGEFTEVDRDCPECSGIRLAEFGPSLVTPDVPGS